MARRKAQHGYTATKYLGDGDWAEQREKLHTVGAAAAPGAGDDAPATIATYVVAPDASGGGGGGGGGGGAGGDGGGGGGGGAR